MNKQQYCAGCYNDFYNRTGNSTTGKCWRSPATKIVTRFRLAWWTAPTEPGAFTKVKTLSCHHEPGRFAFEKKLPDFITKEERKRINANH